MFKYICKIGKILKNVIDAVIGLMRHKPAPVFTGLMTESQVISVPVADTSPTIQKHPKNGLNLKSNEKSAEDSEIKAILPARALFGGVSAENSPTIPQTPKTQELALIKAIMVLQERQNIWDPKIIYAWAHMEGSRWNATERKLYPFDTYLVLQGNNFWGIKKSSFWDKVIINPLDGQTYNRFDNVPEAVGFVDLFVKKGYTQAYEKRNDYKVFFDLLITAGNWGPYSQIIINKKLYPNLKYAKECIQRYDELPEWKDIIKKLEV